MVKPKHRELPSNHRSDLRHFLGGAKPVEPRHQGSIDTALRPVSARSTGCKNDPKLGKKARSDAPCFQIVVSSFFSVICFGEIV